MPPSLSTDPAQQEMDFLMPFGPGRTLLSPREVARVLNRSEDYVLILVGEGKLEAHGHPDREKQRIMVTRRSVLAWLLESALYQSSDHLPRLLNALRTLTTREEITAAMRQLTQQLAMATR